MSGTFYPPGTVSTERMANGDYAATAEQMRPEYSLAKLIQGCVYGTAILPERLRDLIRNQWPSFEKLAHAIHEEKGPADAINGIVVGSGEASVTFTSAHWPSIERALTYAGFKVVRA